MARYDKYEPMAGGFRAALAAAVVKADCDKLVGVSLDTNGRVVVGGDDVVGVLSVPSPKVAGDIVDVMTSGEVVDFHLANGSAAAPGTVYGVGADGAIATTGTRIGHTVGADRLVVRVVPGSVLS